MLVPLACRSPLAAQPITVRVDGPEPDRYCSLARGEGRSHPNGAIQVEDGPVADGVATRPPDGEVSPAAEA